MDRVTRMLPSIQATELISGDGKFNEGFKEFVGDSDTYAVVAIMGPQSSGKSTLMNHLFHTKFEEMNAANGRRKTTRGVWIENAKQMVEPYTIVLDLEGTDGQERGEDNTTFERQTAAFALAVADVIIVNMWCIEVGREHAANRSLLKAIFEAMLLLSVSHKKTLLFVLRDKTKTPVDRLEKDLKKDVEKIWKAAIKPQGSEDTPLAQNFNVMVIALSHYEHMEDTFKDEVAELRTQFFHSISPPGMRNHAERVTSFKNAKKIWDDVKDCKNLDLPSQKVMIATVRCEEIAIEMLRLFESNKEWSDLKKEEATKLVTFNKSISSILEKYLKDYDGESKHFIEDVSKAKREYLKSEVLKVVRPTFVNTLDHQRTDALRSFEAQLKAALNEGKGFAESVRTCRSICELQFDETCRDSYDTFSSDISTMRHQLLRDIQHQWLKVCAEQHRERLSAKFRSELKQFLKNDRINDIWGSIREVLKSESEESALALSSAVVDFELDGERVEELVEELKDHARKMAVTIFKEETKDVQLLLKSRFIVSFSRIDDDDEKRKEDAYRKCVKLLSAVAVNRLVERNDGVEAELLSALSGSHEISADLLASETWEKVSPDMTLITPVKCREIWYVFKRAMDLIYADANNDKKGEPEEVKRLPKWVKLGLKALGHTALAGLMLSCGIVDVTLPLSFIELGIEIASVVADTATQN